MPGKTNLWNPVLSVVILLLLSSFSFGRGPEKASHKIFSKGAVLDPSSTLFNINNWSYWMYKDGISGIGPNGNPGGIYPRGTSNVIYEDGFVWGCKIDGQIRVGGQTYRTGTQALLDRIYRYRSDWKTLTRDQVRQDAAEFFTKKEDAVTDAEIDEIIEQYKQDAEDWPVDEGAPWIDTDGDGIYTKGVDEPGIANADQVVWFKVNDTDPSRTQDLYGSDPIGIELQVTAWGYNQPTTRLGQILFKKYKLINISGKELDDMYVAQWSDPDIGTSSDDLVGCDSVLSMGFAYNGGKSDASFEPFNLAPPAIGYDILQGPMVYTGNPADTAIFNLKRRPGYKNLPMTSFGYFSKGGEWDDPELGRYDGTLEWYNLLRGYIPTNDVNNPIPFTHRINSYEGGPATKFPLNGDPDTGQGDIDGIPYNLAPGDRRMSLNSGPFTMMPGDTQEVVVAVVGGLGSSRTKSVVDLKKNDVVVQYVYDRLFALISKAKEPPAPRLKITPMEMKIVLNWGSDPFYVSRTENTIYKDSYTTGYTFEGYNVYQLPSAISGKADARLIATYDLVDGVKNIKEMTYVEAYGQKVLIPVQFGKDSGVQRYFIVDKDYLTGKPLYPGNTYYFAVTAYNYNPSPQLTTHKTFESPLTAIPVFTQPPKPGIKFTGDPGQSLPVAHTSGNSDGTVKITVINPATTTGHEYEVVFEADSDTNSATYGQIFWDLVDKDAEKTVLSKQVQLAPDTKASDAPLADGLQIRVYGPPVGINPNRYGEAYGKDTPLSRTYLKGWDFTDPRWISGRDRGWIGLFGGLGNGSDHLGTSLTNPTDYMDVDLYFAGLSAAGPADTTIEDIMALSKAENPDRWSMGVAIDGWGDWHTYLAYLPMAAFDVESDPPRRLKLAMIESHGDPSQDAIWDMGWNPVDSTFADDGGYEYFYVLNDDYDTTYTEYLPGGLLASAMFGGWPVLYSIAPAPRGTHPYLEGEFTLMIFASNVNTDADVFSFKAPAVESGIALEREAVEKVTVYPNPYYAWNNQEPNRFTKFIRFFHLPKKATIRLFTLAGDQVRKLVKDDDTQFYNWDLKNERGLPVASGIYFAHIEMTLSDGSKVTKVLKVFIIQRAQMLKYF